MEAYLQELRSETLMEMKQAPDEQPVCEEPSPEMGGDGWWFVDDVSGAVLDASLVGEARQQGSENHLRHEGLGGGPSPNSPESDRSEVG